MFTLTKAHLQSSSLFVRLEAEEKSLLTKIAKEKDCTVRVVMSQAVREFIEREQARLNFFEDGRKAVEHYDQTGLHVTHKEMRAWAESLGNGGELSPPVCHE